MNSSTIVQPVLVEGLRLPKWFLEDGAVQRWLRKYGSAATRRDFAFYVVKYLDWLRVERGVSFSPSALLRANLENVYGSGPTEVERKRMHTDWLQQFVGLEGPLNGLSNSYRRTAAAAVRSFYDRNDSPLFGDFEVPLNSYEERLTRQISVEEAKRYISVLPLRSKAACVCLLQCGIRVSEFLRLRWKTLQDGFERNENPIKITLRNDNGREYFTLLGTDGIEMVKLYLKYRSSILRRQIRPEEYVFINEAGTPPNRTDRPLLHGNLSRQIVRSLVAKGLVEKPGKGQEWRCDFHPHALRHLFKTECAHAGIHPMVSEFWMGHDKGVEYVYNHRHELHPKDFIEMYRKVEPYLNIISGAPGAISEKDQEKLWGLVRELEELKRDLLQEREARRKEEREHTLSTVTVKEERDRS